MTYSVEADAPDIAAALGTWHVLDASGVAASHSGNLLETTVKTVVVPAARMGPNGILRITPLVSYTDNANLKTFRLKLGPTTFYVLSGGAQASAQAIILISNRGLLTAQIGGAAASNGVGSSNAAVMVGGVNTAVAQNLTFTVQLTVATDTMALERFLVEICSRA